MTAICTLFEGHYHYGLAALTNSLYKNGFRGKIWVGYRGELPFWAKPLSKEENYQIYQVAEDCEICFVPLTTDYHLTNYKPHFMLDLWEKYCPKAAQLFYFDPDIVIKCEWRFFEQWAADHVALCEDINSPLSNKNPERLNWKRVLSNNIELPLRLEQYVNGGFVGLSKKNIDFLATWKKILAIIHTEVRPLDASFIPQMKGAQYKTAPTEAFHRMDQDALNAAAMLHAENLSIANKKSMDFSSIGYIMSHALGGNKPWRANYIKSLLDGRGVPLSHKAYWENTAQPISLYSNSKLKMKQFTIRIASFFSRFYFRKL